MSKFTIQDACRLASLTFRYSPRFANPDEQIKAGKANRPFLGKEEGLLRALQAGERRYNECYEEVTTITAMRKSDRELPARCAAFAAQLSEIKSDLLRLDDLSRSELDSIAHWLGSSSAQMHMQIDGLIAWLREASTGEADTEVRKVGRKNGSIARLALGEFAKEIRAFFDEVGTRFGYQNDEMDANILISAAARLLLEASQYLEPGVKPADVKAIITSVNKHPRFRDELLGDPSVEALTN